MMNYRNITLAVVGLFLSVSFLASTVVAAEKDGIMMKNGKIAKMQDGKDIGPMDRATTMANGTKVMMNGKIVTIVVRRIKTCSDPHSTQVACVQSSGTGFQILRWINPAAP